MKYDYIFILTYGRSGSTLLQGILNSIEGVQLRGENNGALFGLIRTYKATQGAKHGFGKNSDQPSNPWYGAADIRVDAFGKALAKAFVEHVLRPDDGTRTTGFKEIRYYPPMLSDSAFEECVFFMRHYFPKAALIVNTREIEAVVRSSKIARHGVREESIRASDARLRAFAERGHRDVFHVHYDDYVHAPERLESLFDFLGAPFDVEQLKAVMGITHSTVAMPPRVSEQKLVTPGDIQK
ncbi:sulfotransferase [Aquibium sp. LZ166]|uniref:Sulfotransferase n=1 Tax=Aquibium pacificus TaxID=3153579 RepID=A0ABV3SJZ4_9HYPH